MTDLLRNLTPPATYDQAQQIIALLREIRDRLPAAPADPGPPDASTMFGYVLGSGEYPTESQVRLAEDWLRRAQDSNRPYLVGEYEAALEIIHAGKR